MLLVLAPYAGFTQLDKNLLSTTLNVNLTPGSSFVTKPELLKTYTALLDSFAITKGYKMAKGNAEIFHTDLDSLKSNLKNLKFTITQEGTTDFYKITKGKNKYLAYIKQDSMMLNSSAKIFPSLQLSILASRYHLIYPFGVTTTITIKRFY